MKYSIEYDDDGDVLYINDVDESSTIYRTSKDDSYIVLRYDSNENITGLTMMAANEMPYEFWKNEHKTRSLLPIDLMAVIDNWLQYREYV